jgi:autotransporter-associated beta strand protein
MATASNGINIASQSGSKGTLNIGAFGGSDIGGTIISPTIALGSGSGGINFNQSASLIIAANISGSNARSTLNQLGSGTTTLTGSNNYDGSTTIKAGMLAAGSLGNGSLSLQGSAKSQASFSDTLGAGTLSIGILSCRGYSTIDLPSGDTLDSIGTITFKGINNLIDLSGAWTTAGDYTLLSGTKITGTGLKALELTGSFMGGLELSLDRSTNYDGLEYTFTNSGTVIELDVNPTTPALSRHFDSLATTSSATAGSLSVVAVPEPSTYLLLVLGMLTVVAVNRKIWL